MTLTKAVAEARQQIELEQATDLLKARERLVRLHHRATLLLRRREKELRQIDYRLETAVPFADVFLRAWRLLLGLESDEEAQADIDFMISTSPPQPTVQERSGGSGDWSGRGTAAMRAIIDKTEKP